MTLPVPKRMPTVVLIVILSVVVVGAIFDGEYGYDMFTSLQHSDHRNKIPTPTWGECLTAMEIFAKRNYTILTTVELVVLDYCLENEQVIKAPFKILSIFENTKKLNADKRNKDVQRCMNQLKEFVHEEHVNMALRHLEPCQTDLLGEYSALIKCTRQIRERAAKLEAERQSSRAYQVRKRYGTLYETIPETEGNYFEVVMSYVSKTMSMCFVQFDRILERDFRQVEDVHGDMLDKLTNKFITKVHLLAPMKFLVSVLTGEENNARALQSIDKVNFRTQQDQDKLLARIKKVTEQMYYHNLAKKYPHRPSLMQDELPVEDNEAHLQKAYQYTVTNICSPLGVFEYDTIFDTYISFLSTNRDVMEELRLDINEFIKTVNAGPYLKPIYYSTRACIFLGQNTIALRKVGTQHEYYFKSIIDDKEQEGLEPIDLAAWP